MTRRLFLILYLCFLVLNGIHAQSDIISLADAIRIFQNPTQKFANDILTKQGYKYKGVTTEFGKEYNWVRNMDLNSDNIPTAFQKGNSSLFLLAADGKTAYLYIFNNACFLQLQVQAKRLGYSCDATGKASGSAMFFIKEDAPTLTFMKLEKPLPYCVQITE